MKCIILAGGKGERLWPLSRKNCPKQFIRIQGNHSLFQETVARNISFCDEFIIVTGEEHKDIVENQMKAFRGTSYRCIYEAIPRRTTASILLAILDLQPSEFVFVVASDHLIESGDDYKDAILLAKKYAATGSIALMGKEDREPNIAYGYLKDVDEEGRCGSFEEKPGDIDSLCRNGSVYRNLGMMIFQNGCLINEMRKNSPAILTQCRKAYGRRVNGPGYTLYREEVLNTIDPISIERCLLEKSSAIRMVRASFGWDEITSLEDLEKTEFKTSGISIYNNCHNVSAVNDSPAQAVVINGLDDVLLVNTDDAIYVGKRGQSRELKKIIKEHPELAAYSEKSNIGYRPWGYYIQLEESRTHHIRAVHLMPGKTIYEHSHRNRIENWTILSGEVMVTVNGEIREAKAGNCFHFDTGVRHQVSNIGTEEAVIVDISVGDQLHEEERLPRNPESHDVSEAQLGVIPEPFIKLRPAFKDYLWGGSKLRDKYHMVCDYEQIAEAWLLSAHPAGRSIVASGRHEGMDFARYIDTVGKAVLGWKCSPLQSFPLLMKLIDARENLSVQVHPDDDYALSQENEYGKNEMWYVVESEPGAGLYVGFNRDVTREEVRERVENNSIMEILNFYPTKAGDVFYIPAGTVHAIGAGNLICEIQQSSNVTYRLYDFDRTDKFGNRRELHLDKALNVINYSRYDLAGDQIDNADEDGLGRTVCRCKYFESSVYDVDGPMPAELSDSVFSAFAVVRGSGSMVRGDKKVELRAGDSVFVPAGSDKLEFDGKMTVLSCHI